MGQRRQNDRERPDRLAQDLERAAKVGHQPADLRAARPRQHNDQRRKRPPAARLIRVRPQFAEALDQRMADIDAARPLQPPIGLGLERQQRQHAIDIGPHRPGAPGPPGPDARTDVVDDRQIRQGGADAAGYAVGEVRAVDDDERVRPRGDDRPCRLADAREKLRQPGQHRQDAHDRDVADRKEAREPLSLHRLTANAGEYDLACMRLLKRAHELVAELVA